ncbi:MAG: PEP/pyruvate-binding domain-containing protein, partial [Anaerolineales bacterium]
GILFTINPLTGSAGEVMINAAWGLGEAIVGGQVNPDAVIVDKATGRVKQIEIGDKAVMTAPTAQGTIEVEIDPTQRQRAALTSEQAAELAQLGQAIEQHFGGPQDIEWAIAEGKAYILQSRPVTTLPAPEAGGRLAVPGDDAWLPLDDGPAQRFDVWTQADVGERWPEPVTPLTWSTWHAMMNENLRDSFRHLSAPYLKDIRWARRAYGRIYFNEGAMNHILIQEYGVPDSLMAAALGSQGASKSGWRWGTVLRRLPMFLSLARKWMKDEKTYQSRFPQIEQWVNGFMQRDSSNTSDADLWAEAQTLWRGRAMENMTFHAEITGMSMTNLPMLESMLARQGQRELAQTLLNGISGVIQAELVPMLWAIAHKAEELGLAGLLLENEPKAALDQLRATPTARPLLDMLDQFLQRHGHRAPLEAEWLYPRWSEAPELVIETLASYLRAGDKANSGDGQERQRRQREEALVQIEKRLDPISRAMFRGMLNRTQHLVRLRDNGQHYLVKLALPMRHIYAMLGERWAARSWLELPEDFFFLLVPEIEAVLTAGDPASAALDLRARVTRRRNAYRHWFSVSAPEVLDASGRPTSTQSSESISGEVLSGVPASGGKVRGAARVIAHPREMARLQPGDILVTRATDPGWTPAFSLISGLVLEVGGQLSHGAIVAREYGLPAVVNVPEATRRIQEGQILVVDGSAGRVYLNGDGHAAI